MKQEQMAERIETAMAKYEENQKRPQQTRKWRKLKKGSAKIGLDESGRPTVPKVNRRDKT